MQFEKMGKLEIISRQTHPCKYVCLKRVTNFSWPIMFDLKYFPKTVKFSQIWIIDKSCNFMKIFTIICFAICFWVAFLDWIKVFKKITLKYNGRGRVPKLKSAKHGLWPSRGGVRQNQILIQIWRKILNFKYSF